MFHYKGCLQASWWLSFPRKQLPGTCFSFYIHQNICPANFIEIEVFRRANKEWYIATATAKSLQSCPTLCDPIDSSPPGSPVPGILQARTLEWVAISFSSAGKWKVKVKSLSRVQLFTIPWTAAYQAPPSMGFSRQEYWSGVPLPSPSDILRCVKTKNLRYQIDGK